MAERTQPRVRLTPVDFDPFSPRPGSTALPLTEAQAEMWAAVQMGPEASSSYNQCFPLRLRGRLDVGALREALRKVVARHAALRATFDAEGQTIQDALLVDLPVEDLAGRELERILEDESREPFDLGKGPPLRARLVREAEDAHTLVLTAHHLVCDGWSSGVLLSDLGALYSAGVLPEPASYVDYVRAVTSPDAVRERRAAEEYWAGKFAEAVPVVDLPTDHLRPPFKTYRGMQENLEVEASLMAAVKLLGARHGCTLYTTLLAGFQALLYRLTGQTDVVVGIPVAGQAGLDNTHLVGHCVHTLPLRSRLDPESSFAAHLSTVRDALLEAQAHQGLTFGTLVRRLKLPRDPSRTPLVGIVFNVDRLGPPPAFSGLAAEPIVPPKSFVNFELYLNLVDAGSRLVIESSFNLDLFDPQTVRRWMGHYLVLLRAAAEAPQQPLSALPLLSEPERRQILVEWNDTAAAIPEPRVLHRLVEEQARRTPKAEAVSDGETRLTYEELNRRANQLARHLRGRGVGPEVLVGICLERSVDLEVALLGVLKAGGAYLPLDPAHPPDRLEFMLKDAGVALVVTQQSLREAVPQAGGGLLSIDGDRRAFGREDDADLEDGAAPEDLAYVLYTSGSTGRPKGVEICHRALVNFLWSMRREPGFGESDTLLALTTLSFDIAGLELFLPLVAGGRVELVSREVAQDGRLLRDRLERSGATVMQATPTTWRLLLEAGWSGKPGLTALCGGEGLPPDLADRLLSRVATLWNMYGPTETTIWSTLARIEGDDSRITIGRPIANTQVYILDGGRRPVPVGVPGELYIGGDGLARGYRRRPDLTAERFVSHPFPSRPGERVYRTGDVARRLPDGRIECLGRVDHQVKLRGFRIEPGEIEASLTLHPAVKDAVVVVHEFGEEDRRLVAYLTTGLPAAEAATVLREHLRARLPEYMVPSDFVAIAALPLTPNGKVDRKALPSPVPPAPKGRPAPPRSPQEEGVATIWRDLLKRPEVGIHDNFFELGGHSMLAARILARLRAAFGVNVPMRSLFERPTVAGLAEVVEALQWAAQARRGIGGKEAREETLL